MGISQHGVLISHGEAAISSLGTFRNRHHGGTILICGCGASLNELESPDRFVTIGVNDVGRKFQPDYLVVVNPRNQFKDDRFKFVESSQAKFVFSQLDLGLGHARQVRFRLGVYGGTDLSDPQTLHFTRNSPYVAACLAAQMGATRIGLLGVDFTDHHFFGSTGRHPLTGSLAQIDGEYKKLADALAARGVQLVNLSRQSLLSALPKQDLSTFAGTPSAVASEHRLAAPNHPRVFFVHYRFISCGDVFRKGLSHAAADLKIPFAEAYWDESNLKEKVREFKPDLLFVVHGRRFSSKWQGLAREFPSAVWLLDEPYEVDDTAKFSRDFQWTFVNDPSTLSRHPNSHYLPTCFDPHAHFDSNEQRPFGAGFIGGGNAARERWLSLLAENGILAYVVGGPWKNPLLNGLCLARNIPEQKTAELYRQTRIVINIFREQHHFNRDGLPAHSLNPRIYEALACGALVISEPRPELEEFWPALPIFRDESQLVELVRDFTNDHQKWKETQRQCAALFQEHTYANRLRRALRTCGFATAPCCANGSDPLAVRPAIPVPLKKANPKPDPVKAMPFTAMPRRNLIYHVWPVRDSLWRWNISQLLQRLDIFNGRRIIGIVHDAKSDPPEAVMEALDGHGCEFVVRPNSPIGEAVTFPEMLARVASVDPNEITFYGHAKGVKYGAQTPSPVRQWAEALYATTLDDWLRVWEQLQQYAMTGAFKMQGRFRAHRECSEWHYSGTFFWMRHSHVFSRAWQNVPGFYCGVEAWPGTLFRAEETGCLLFDGLTRLPYDARFWQAQGDPALNDWRTRRKLVPVPDGLSHPKQPLDIPGPRLEQSAGEFDWLATRLISSGAQRVLTRTADHGGLEWWLARAFHEANRFLQLTILDPAPTPQLRATLAEATARFGARFHLVEGKPGTPQVQTQLAPPYDALFSDAGRGYAQVRADWELARAVGAGQVAFHDIVDSHWHVQCRCCVSRLWHELAAQFSSTQCAGNEWGGIGVILPALSGANFLPPGALEPVVVENVA